MTGYSILFSSMVAAAVAAAAASPSTTVSISGTVKVTGSSPADVVVYIQQAPGPITPSSKPARMDQRQMQFIPRVLPIVAGTKVMFLNSDPTPHNVLSPDNEKFNLGTWPQGQTKEYTFNKCTKFPCVYTLLCRVHPEMEGNIVVLQNTFFAVTGKDGRYEIDGVPAGAYTLAVWHTKAKAQPRPVTIAADKQVTVDFALGR
jgi:plastocyanin